MRGTDNREKNLVREFIVDPERVVYDAASGRLVDVSADELKVIGMPALPPGMELEEVDVIIRVRSRP